MMKTLHSLFPRNWVRYRKSNWNSARSYSPLEQQTGKSQTVSYVDYKMKPVSSFIHIWSVKWLKSEDLQKRLKQWRLWQLYLFLSVWPLLLLKVRLFLIFLNISLTQHNLLLHCFRIIITIIYFYHPPGKPGLGIQRCLCLGAGVKMVKPKLIEKVEIHPISPSCGRLEVV